MIADLALRTNGPYQGASVPACGTISSALVWKGRRTIRVGAGHEHQKTLAGLDVTLAALSGTALGASAPSQASVTRDQHFDWRLTDPNQDSPLVIWNFSLVRAQGVGLCQARTRGRRRSRRPTTWINVRWRVRFRCHKQHVRCGRSDLLPVALINGDWRSRRILAGLSATGVSAVVVDSDVDVSAQRSRAWCRRLSHTTLTGAADRRRRCSFYRAGEIVHTRGCGGPYAHTATLRNEASGSL